MKHDPNPVVRYDEQRAKFAYLAHVAMIAAEIQDPSLRDNPAWTVLRQDAYENFELAFEGRLS